MKKELGPEWGRRERDKGHHPLFRWLRKTEEHCGYKAGEPKVRSVSMKRFIACWLNLAYALYLIAYHDQVPKLLLKRLRNPATFMPAYHEAIVGAALAVAGMEITCAETKAGSVPTPEFRAKSRTSGKTYEVEAKRKNGWTAPTDDVSSPEFRRELQSYVRGQIYAASKKRLANPIYWFELSIATMLSEADWRAVAEQVREVILGAEHNVTVDGAPIGPAYVVVSNHTFLADEDIEGHPFFGMLQTIKIDDYPYGRPVELEAALEGYDKHRDVFWLMEAWKTAMDVPITFDGSPPELLDGDGRPQRTIKIGDLVQVSNGAGQHVPATVQQVCSAGNGEAMLVVQANGDQSLVSMPLTEGEVQAALRYTDAVFGEENASRRLRDDDPFDFYDWMLDVYAKMTKENVEKFFEQHPPLAHYSQLSLPAARIRIAREYTKLMWRDRAANGQGAA